MFDRNELIHAAFSLRDIAHNELLPIAARSSAQRGFEVLAVELAIKHNIDPRFWDSRETIHCL